MRAYIDIINEGDITPADDFIEAAKAISAQFAGHATFDLGIPWDSTKTDFVEIEHIEATVMKQGWGTKVMAAICALADEKSITLTLGVANETDDFYHDDEDENDDDGMPSEDDLISFYSGFGFEQKFTMSDRVTMVRTPN